MDASDRLLHPARVARLDGLGAGLGGEIKQRPEDFVVEEIPLFRPTGRGDHTIVQIEKRATATFDALLFLSKTAKVSERVIGYAGLKDARAVATQFVSLPKVPPERVLAIHHRKFRVLSAIRNEKPLRIGYLKGNRFTIRIRDADVTRVERAREVLEILGRRGIPNAYGRQRFGIRQDGHLLGRAMLLEDWRTLIDHLLGMPCPAEKNPQIVQARVAYDAGLLDEAHDLFPIKHRNEKKASGVLSRGGSPREAYESVGRGPRRIWLSAWQSYLFNRVLDQRLREGTFDTLLDGDIAWLHASSATYPVRDAAAERERAERGLASPTGPLIGFDPVRPTGAPGRLEQAILDEEETDAEAFRATHAKARGLRRPLRIPLDEASIEVEADGVIRVGFILPPGCFATVVLEYLMGEPVPVEGTSGG